MVWDTQRDCSCPGHYGDYAEDFTKQTFLFSLTDCEKYPIKS